MKGLRIMVVFLLLFVGSLTLFANDLNFNATETAIKITGNTYNALNFTNSLSGARFIEVRTEKGVFDELLILGYGGSNIIGEPKLPVIRKLIEIPLDAKVEVKLVRYDVEEYDLNVYGITYPLIPAQPPIPKDKNPDEIEFQYNPSAYQLDEYSGQDLVTVDVLGIMRGVRIGRLNIAPIQYNPVKNKIKVFNNIKVEIHFVGADIIETEMLKKSTYSPFFEGIYRQIFNYKPLDTSGGKDTIIEYPIKYVIISDPMFEDALQPFIQWKQKKGFYVIEGYTDDPAVGSTTSSISAYLEDLYNQGTPDDPAPSFVLLVGDVNQVPAFSSGGHVTDLYYCEYTGDYLPELFYGRFSANNLTELQPQIDKTLEYEQYLMPDPSFLNEVVMISGVDAGHAPTWGNGQINYGTDYYFNEAHGITSHTYLYPESGSSGPQIIQDVSNGVAYANYTAHGSSSGWANPSFSISDIATLQNQSKYPLMVGNACSTNEFGGTCFGEALLRAENKGAIGYIGGSASTYWDEDYWWGVGYGAVSANPTYEQTGLGAYDRTFHDHGEPQEEWYATQDGMIYAGNLAVTESGSSRIQYYWEIYHLMGDPSLMVYYSEPPVMTANYNAMLPIGIDEFTVTTEPNAYVAISMDGELHGAALADETGIAVVSIEPFTIPGIAEVVITKQNKQPFIGTVTVAPAAGPYVIYSSNIIDDVTGNNNGLIDFGEDIGLSLEMYNAGSDDATDVVVSISSDDDYITIIDDTENYGTIPAEDSVMITNGFAFTVADDVPDFHNILFNVQAVSDTFVWESNFSLVAHAPILEYDSFTIDDTQGNGDGKVDPGE
ncbi:MAG: Gingipain R, partial [Candidatus Cloacimonadota bacterium]